MSAIVADYSLERGLPASIETECSILGSIMLDNSLFHQAASSLTADHFSLDAHRKIFRRMAALQECGSPIDPVTLVEELGKHKELEAIGGLVYVSELMGSALDRSSIEYHVRIVRDKALLRGLINICQASISQAIDHPDDAQEAVGWAERAITELATENIGKKPLVSVAEATPAAYDAMFQQEDVGVSLTIPLLDMKTDGGIRPEELFILGGDPGSGKSALASQIAAENARAGKRVAFWSIEMKAGRILRRLWCYESGLFYSKLKHSPDNLSSPDRELFDDAVKSVAEWPVLINDASNLTPQTFAAQARHAVLRNKIDLVILDHVQIMTACMPGADEIQKVMKISATLRQFAKDYCPILALSQLSRMNKEQRGQRPTMRDLKGSSALEQDASVIVLVYHPKIEESETGEDELILAKNREGQSGVVPVRFRGALMRFLERQAT